MKKINSQLSTTFKAFLLIFAIIVLDAGLLFGQIITIDRNKPDRTEWFTDMGFGMFIHWSVDVQLGVSPETGTVVTHYKRVLTGQSTIDVIFKLPRIEDPIWHDYPEPCSITRDIMNIMRRSTNRPLLGEHHGVTE